MHVDVLYTSSSIHEISCVDCISCNIHVHEIHMWIPSTVYICPLFMEFHVFNIFVSISDYMLAQVVVMTHSYGTRSGVRYMTRGLKVYYVPWRPFLMQNTLPTFYGTLPIVRSILIREKITLVHGHQAFSTLCHEALMHARTMGYKVVFTDHSLYGFGDVGSIHMNKVLQFTLADVSQAICVSHTSKENTVLRSQVPPEKVFVIPNAVDTAVFKPAPKRLSYNQIVIVVISRLVYRKGADLLVEVIPEVCRLFPNVSILFMNYDSLIDCFLIYGMVLHWVLECYA